MNDELQERFEYEKAVDLLASDRELFGDVLSIVAEAEARAKAARAVCGTRENRRTWRNALDDAARIRYERDGDVKFEARVGGRKIGTYTARISKGRDAETVARMEAANEDIAEFLKTEGEVYLERLVSEHRREILDWALSDGVRFEGSRVVEFDMPAEPEMFANTALSIDLEAAADALGMHTNERLAGLLEG